MSWRTKDSHALCLKSGSKVNKAHLLNERLNKNKEQQQNKAIRAEAVRELALQTDRAEVKGNTESFSIRN